MAWRTIPFAPDYEACEAGRIRRSDTRAEIAPQRQADGYRKVWLVVDGRSRAFRLHRVIAAVFIGDVTGRHVDHRNRRRGDNRARNLRICEATENNANRRRARKTSAPFRGVSLEPSSGRWRAFISERGRNRALGRFDDPAEAARAYDRAALAIFGAFASLNFPAEARP
jgi:hypothetical protein